MTKIVPQNFHRLGRNYIGANAKAKVSLIFAATQYKHASRKSMYPFQAVSLSRSLSLQYKCTLTQEGVPDCSLWLIGGLQRQKTCFDSNAAGHPLLLVCVKNNRPPQMVKRSAGVALEMTPKEISSHDR